MSSIDKYARLQSLGRPVVTTGEAAAAWGASSAVSAALLSRLAASGLVVKLSHGLWQIGRERVDVTFVLPTLTNPYPSYVSGWTALAQHGMIEQIPRDVFAASLDRARTVVTTVGRFQIHHLHPQLLGGFEGATGIRSGVARPEKALFDIVYLFSVRQGKVTLPELELTKDFDHRELRRWVEAIPSTRLKTLTDRNVERLVVGAVTQLA
jgi:predicted transcriptional regulator of viral defense system